MPVIKFADRFDGISGSAIREIFKLIAKPDMISFAGGNPALSALPDDIVADIAKRVLNEDGKRILQYGATEGYPPLLESLKPYVAGKIGEGEYTILPTTGSTQGMDLLCKALINPGDVILVEDPTFLGNMQCMRLYQADLKPVASDEHGIIPEAIEQAILQYQPKMLYIIPNFQNPTGVTLAADRRQKIAELAAKYQVVVAEDDPYRDLRYDGVDLPPIKTYDKEGWVVYLGSFSKIISPGMRVGYLAGDPGLIRKCTIGKQSSDLHTANLTQAIVDRYLREDLLDAHVKRICVNYAEQLHLMLDELASFPMGTKYTRPEGGLFIWLTLPESINSKELLNRAIGQKVAFVPGEHFYCDGGHENTLRLNFSNSTPEQIRTGMAKLRNVIFEMMGE